MPTFVVGEFVFISLTVLLLLHALKQGRVHTLIWFSALVSGTANDVFFMALPIVENFWQGQACIMITPRMPLYIPCVYIVFMYTSTVAAWRLGRECGFQNALSLAALTGLMGEMIYSPYDIIGIKFLWWTWHDTDAPIRDRLYGVPVGSSSWVITFTASFQLLHQLTIPKPVIEGKQKLTNGKALFCLLVNGLLATPLMMVQMSLFQLISGDLQGFPTTKHTFVAILTLFTLLATRILFNRVKSNALQARVQIWDLIINLALVLYFCFLFAIMMIGKPEDHSSTGVHQEVGDCSVKGIDISGHERQVYLCKDSYEEDFSFNCKKTDYETSQWYTVCGNPHKDKPTFVAVIGLLGLMGSIVYTRVLSLKWETICVKKI